MISKMRRRFLAGALAGVVSFSTIGMIPMIVQAKETDESLKVSVNTEMVTDASTDVLYRFVPNTSGNYEFYSMESGDTYGCIYDANKNVLYSDNDGGEELNFSINAELEANTEYYLGVSYFEIGAEGEIKWMVEERVDSISEENEAIVVEQTQPLETVMEEISVTNNGTTADGVYEYTEENSIVTITKYNGTDEILTIPETIDGKPVGIIGKKAFLENQTVKEVTIPKTVTEIQYAAFADCKNLGNIRFVIDSTLEKMGTWTFAGCSALIEIHLPDSLIVTEGWNFAECTSLTEVTFGEGLDTISTRMFRGTTGLKNIVFPKQITNIDYLAFEHSGLASLNISDNITQVGRAAFRYCEALEEVKIGKGIDGISHSMFWGTINLRNIEFPSNITYIGEKAFSYGGLEYLNIPDTVTSIERKAFRGCENLKEVIIGNGLTYLGESIFEKCGLENITLGENIRVLGKSVFKKNENLREFVVPDTVTELEYAVFASCTNLETILIPESITSIGSCAFCDCISLEKVIIPESITTIEKCIFYDCISLTEIIIPKSVTTIEEYAFLGCISLKEIKIPNSVLNISDFSIGYYSIKNGCCEIVELIKISDFKIIGDTDSAAEAYAEKHGFIFEKNVYTVNFYNGEELISTQQIVSGESAEAPVLTKEGYTLEWDTNFNNVKQNLNVKAVWKNTTVVTNPFTDVSDSVYYYQPVLWALENNVTAGISATQFAPEQSCTRGQVVTFLWRAMGCPEPSTTTNPFVDVDSNQYYYKAVLWALENGITAGIDATHFAPDETVTRGQFVTFLHRAENKPSYSVSNPFTDVPNTYYYDAVLWAYENGVTAGTDSTHFSPEEFCTRGQVVTFLYRALNDK